MFGRKQKMPKLRITVEHVNQTCRLIILGVWETFEGSVVLHHAIKDLPSNGWSCLQLDFRRVGIDIYDGFRTDFVANLVEAIQAANIRQADYQFFFNSREAVIKVIRLSFLEDICEGHITFEEDKSHSDTSSQLRLLVGQ